MLTPPLYADVVLPLALPRSYTYIVPAEMAEVLCVGVRVVVPFGRSKLYMGIAIRLHHRAPDFDRVKTIEDIVDPQPVISPLQLRFWGWMVNYYLCTPGDMLRATLPSGMKLEQETELIALEEAEVNERGLVLLPQQKALLAEIRNTKSAEAGRILKGSKGKAAILNGLIQQGLVQVCDKMSAKSRAKRECFVRLNPEYAKMEALGPLLDSLERAAQQQKVLLGLAALIQEDHLSLDSPVSRARLLRYTGANATALKGIEKKGIVRLVEMEVSSLPAGEPPSENFKSLSAEQEKGYREILKSFERKNVTLLMGVTGSGKTEVYIRLIAETLAKGEQAVYILPEIALTTQIVMRLQAVFGDRVGVYHSRQSDRARVELYEALLHGGDTRTGVVYDVILGARSALFLPYRKLGLIVVDEEHEGSYRQIAPAPRYNARDAAIQLASMAGAKVLLGSATPSVESYTNALSGKYGYVELKERFGESVLPSVQIVDIRVAEKEKQMQLHFSQTLIEAIREVLQQGGQTILFQNRRGYSPYIECEDCCWVAECPNCDASLIYHKRDRRIHCHHCGYTEDTPSGCKACGSVKLQWRGLGTQRVEEELAALIPEAIVGRLDLDTTRGKDGATRVIQSFAEGEVNVLVGTQMVTKGLDFRNVQLVGILDADGLLRQADYRATERAYQLMAQVGGRAGRRKAQGRVLIQTRTPGHPIFQWVAQYDYKAFYEATIREREETHFPPYTRLVTIEVEDKEEKRALEQARDIANELHSIFGEDITPPFPPSVAWVRNRFRYQLLIRRSTSDLGQSALKKLSLYRHVKITIDP